MRINSIREMIQRLAGRSADQEVMIMPARGLDWVLEDRQDGEEDVRSSDVRKIERLCFGR